MQGRGDVPRSRPQRKFTLTLRLLGVTLPLVALLVDGSSEGAHPTTAYGQELPVVPPLEPPNIGQWRLGLLCERYRAVG